MSKNININMKPYPVNFTVVEDSLTLELSDSSTRLVGRLSGYSDSELIKPTLTNDGYFEWFNPAFNPEGKVFVRPVKKNVQIFNSVNALGVYAGKFEYDFIKDKLNNYENKLVYGNYLFYYTLPISSTAGSASLELDIRLSTNITGNVYPAYLHYENNSAFKILHSDEENDPFYLFIEYPYPVSIDGIFSLGTISGQVGKQMLVESSLDKINWIQQGKITNVVDSKYNFIDFDFDEDSEDNDRETLTFFEKTAQGKYFRISALESDVSLKLLMPFKDIRTLEKITLLKYDDINVDPDSFQVIETDDTIKIAKVQSGETADLTMPSDSRTLERAVFLEDDRTVSLFRNKIISFNRNKEIAPGVTATIPYVNLSGGITLEAGSYEIEVELKAYSFDYRTAYGESLRMYAQVQGFYFTDSISNGQLTETQVMLANFYLPDMVGITFKYSDNISRRGDPLSDVEDFNGRWPMVMRSSSTSTVDMVLPSRKKLKGIDVLQSYDYYTFRSITVYGLEDDGSWTKIKKFESDQFMKVRFYGLLFDNPVSYKEYRLSLEPLKEGSYSGLSKVFPNYFEEDDGLIKPDFKMITQLVLSGKTTIALRSASNSITYSPTIYKRSIEIYKLGANSLAENYRSAIWGKTLSQSKVFGSDVDFNCINTPIGSDNYKEMSLNTGDSFSIYFPGPVKLYRRGEESKKVEVSKFNITAASSEREDVSHLNFSPFLLDNTGLSLFDGSSKTNIVPKSTSSSDGSPEYYLVKDNYSEETTYITKDPDLEFVTVGTKFNDPITVNVIKERLVSTFTKVSDVYTGSPKDIIVEALNLENSEWEVVGKIDEQYKMSLDGTPRSGAGNYDGTVRIAGDGKTRFYPLDKVTTSTEFRFHIYTSSIGRLIALNTLSVAFAEDDYDFKSYKDALQQYERWNEVICFTDVIPAGTYIFEATGSRTDSEWYVESAIGEI